ncbi:MAG: selenide, water dikinase SelD [Rhodobacterales bacterium]|nr:MAG: selenide, water dikinase SelD [Rhodobacterales bacterium]
MLNTIPLTRDLVLIGGGHAHAIVARMWGMNPLPGVRLTLINPGPTAPYSGMLPGHIAGHYARGDLDIDLVKLARFAGARLIVDKAVFIDPEARVVRLASGREIAYDVASIDVGIHAEMPAIEGFSQHALGAKPLDTFAARWSNFRALVRAGEVAPEVAVIGGGVAGVELALAMDHALKSDGTKQRRVSLIEARSEITSRIPATADRLRRALEKAGIALHLASEVTRIEADGVQLSTTEKVPSRFTLGAAGTFAHPWLKDCDLPLTEDGFITVGPDLAVKGRTDLFAVGDCAHMAHAPRPKAGVFAVRSGPILAANLKTALSGGKTRAYKPQKDYLKLISLGGKRAVAEKGGRAISGALIWRWKNHIDQKFMKQFRHLPFMRPDALPRKVASGVAEERAQTQPILCGGCGSKLGHTTLKDALSALPAPARADVLSGPGDDAGVLDFGATKQVLTTDHLRAFIEDPARFARITTLHALGDIWAMGAAPQAALISVTLPRMSQPLAARTMAEIMGAIQSVLQPLGAEIIGGHSTFGAEMQLGLTLTGTLSGDPIQNTGAEPGDKLILTRPIGSGVLLAAEMRGVARGGDVQSLLTALEKSDHAVAARLAEHAKAMTDVTGFGLAGHLASICGASGVGAVLNAAEIPVWRGALKLAQAGVRSSAFDANRAAAPVKGAAGPLGDLLYDPQTAGGLLAAIAPDRADEVLAALGETASIIGEITKGSGINLRSGG